ncbi:MAG: peptidoglycan-binding protein [Alphaproteobacteria bacterium]|nr:peptidoglycan-binding protein [Alphaproteobacteria bacterium]
MVGAVIVNGANAKPQRSSSSSISSAQRAENKEIQTALNYYGFNAGTPDGVFGGKTRQAVSYRASTAPRNNDMSQHVCCAQIYIFVTERTVPFGVLACLLILRRDLGPYLVLSLR